MNIIDIQNIAGRLFVWHCTSQLNPERELNQKRLKEMKLVLMIDLTDFRFVNFFHVLWDFTSTVSAGAVIPDFIIWLAAQNHCGFRPGYVGKVTTLHLKMLRYLMYGWLRMVKKHVLGMFLNISGIYRPQNSTISILPWKSRYLTALDLFFSMCHHRMILQAEFQRCIRLIWGKTRVFSSEPVILRKNPGFSPRSRVKTRFPFKPEKFVGLGS